MKGIDNIFIYEYATSAESVTYEVYVNGELYRTAIAYKEPNASVIRINVSQYAKSLIDVGELKLDYLMVAPKVSIKIFDETMTEERFKPGNDEDGECFNVTGKVANGMLSLRFVTLPTTNPSIGCITYTEEVNDCGDWALYYLNKTGGWDYFLIKGKVIESDNIDRKSIISKESGTKVYRTVGEKSYKINTGILTDEQSKRIAEQLFISRNIILLNLRTGEMKGVNITDTSVEHLQYRNKMKPNNYTITVKENNKQYYG